MTNNQSNFDRRKLADDARYLSILDRRCQQAKHKLHKTQIELAMARLGFQMAMGGIVVSWILFVSMVLPK